MIDTTSSCSGEDWSIGISSICFRNTHSKFLVDKNAVSWIAINFVLHSLKKLCGINMNLFCLVCAIWSMCSQLGGMEIITVVYKEGSLYNGLCFLNFFWKGFLIFSHILLTLVRLDFLRVDFSGVGGSIWLPLHI